ncbi:unnamed protein product [Clavelina lepadiformis]|uniref:Uncharacterized protein n=1 Tax=Clavelina lepadiformis TaxID=159417 RepID=A0ABP0GRL3_CLALP
MMRDVSFLGGDSRCRRYVNDLPRVAPRYSLFEHRTKGNKRFIDDNPELTFYFFVGLNTENTESYQKEQGLAEAPEGCKKAPKLQRKHKITKSKLYLLDHQKETFGADAFPNKGPSHNNTCKGSISATRATVI